jgi:hypothetical protein
MPIISNEIKKDTTRLKKRKNATNKKNIDYVKNRPENKDKTVKRRKENQT